MQYKIGSFPSSVLFDVSQQEAILYLWARTRAPNLQAYTDYRGPIIARYKTCTYLGTLRSRMFWGGGVSADFSAKLVSC